MKRRTNSPRRSPFGNHINSWAIILTKSGWIILHNCGKKRHRRHLHKPVWGSEASRFKDKFSKWTNPKCARCCKDIPDPIILAAGMRDRATVAEINKSRLPITRGKLL